MNIDRLREKIAASEEKVAKCKKTIERHRAQMEKYSIELQKIGINPETTSRNDFFVNGSIPNKEVYWLFCSYDDKKDDIKGAIMKLAAAERICAGWKEKLDIEINNEKVIQDTVPKVIKDFLEDWKEKAFDWYVKRYDDFLVYRDNLRKQEREARLEAYYTLPEYEETRERYKSFLGDKEPDNHILINMYPHKPMDAFLKERHLDSQSIKNKINNFGDQVIFKMLEYRDEGKRLEFLAAALEEEKKRKLLSLISSITAITGPIVDAKHLYVSAGDLNGVIVGEKGVAKIQTFSAGGYNIQCFHYRTRVDDVTKKYIADPSVFIDNNSNKLSDERVCTYQFPRFEGGDDMVARDYGLEVVGSTKDDTLVKGQYRDIVAFADQYLGYQLVPEYLKDVEDKPGLDEVISKCLTEVKNIPPIKLKDKER